MTPLEQKIAKALWTDCTFLPGSYDKRFVRDMAAHVDYTPDKPLSQKQHDLLIKQFHRYRRQVRDYQELCQELNNQLKVIQ